MRNRVNPENKRFFSVSELAKALKTHVTTIRRNEVAGKLVSEAAGFDLLNDVNMYFIRSMQSKKGLPIKPLHIPEEEPEKKKVKLVRGKDGKLKKVKPKAKKKSLYRVDDPKTEEETRAEIQGKARKAREVKKAFKSHKTKAEADIARINAQTIKYNVQIAESMKLLIARKMVDRLFGQINSISSNQLLTLGERLAPNVAAMCGVTDPEIILKIKKRIEREVTRILIQIKEIAEQEI